MKNLVRCTIPVNKKTLKNKVRNNNRKINKPTVYYKAERFFGSVMEYKMK